MARYLGTIEDRFEHLTRIGRRCDGNSKQCVNPAVDEYDVLLTNGFGTPLGGAQPEIRRSCGRHRAQFMASGRLVITETRRIANPVTTRRPDWADAEREREPRQCA